VLDLGGLPRAVFAFALAELLVLGAAAAVVVATAFAWPMPGPSVEIPQRFFENPSSLPLVVGALTSLSACVAAAAVAWSAVHERRWLSAFILVAVGLLGLSYGLRLIIQGELLAAAEGLFSGPASSSQVQASGVLQALGWSGVLAGLVTAVLALLPRRLWARARLFVPALAALPFTLGAIALMFGSGAVVDAGEHASAYGFPRVLTAAGYVAPALSFVALVGGMWLIPLEMWQAVVWAHATRDIGVWVSRISSRLPLLLVALLGAKLMWLVLGYLGLLPLVLGGQSEVWAASRNDGFPAWLIAFVLAALIGAWLFQQRRVVLSERGLLPAALLLVGGFTVVTVLQSLTLVGFELATRLPATGRLGSLATLCGTDWATEALGNTIKCRLLQFVSLDLIVPSQLFTLGVALVLGTWLVLRRSPAGIWLIGIVVWVSPRIFDVVASLAAPSSPPRPIAPEVATFDTALTVVVATLAALWWTNWQRAAPPAQLLLILAVSTLLAHVSTVVPDYAGPGVFYLALLFPVTYELLFRAHEVNSREPGRPARLLQYLALRCAGVGFIALLVALGSVLPGEPSFATLGYVLFAVPFSLLLVGASLSPKEVAATSPVETSRRRTVQAAGIVILALVLVAVVGRLITLPESPQASQRLEQFQSRRASQLAHMQTLLETQDRDVDQVAATGRAMASLAREETHWLTAHPPHSCFADAHSKLNLALEAFAHVGRVYGTPRLWSTTDEWVSAVEDIEAEFFARLGTFQLADRAAAERCQALSASR
jgi:hypothetical protein